MKHILSGLVFVVLIAAVASVGYFAYLFYLKKSHSDILAVVPKSAVLVIETDSVRGVWSTLNAMPWWKALAQTNGIADFEKNIALADEYLVRRTGTQSLLGNRRMLVSLHMLSGKQMGFLFVMDLDKAPIEDLYSLGMGFENEMQTSRKYKGYEIRKIQAFDGKNDLFLCLVNNVLSMSLHEALIEEEIAQITDYNWLSTNESRRFRSVYAQGGVKLYANMLVFAQFVNSFLGDELSILKDLSAGVSQSVGSLTIDTVGLSFKGVTLIDSINSFADALRNTRPVSTNAYNCISDEAALVLEVGYDSQLTLFAHWFDNTKHERKQLLDAPEWRAIRKLLGDSVVAKMLLNYGTGFSLVKFRPTNTLKTNDVMLVLPVDTAHGQLKMFQMLQGFFGQMNPDRPQVIEHHGFLVAPLYPRDFVSAFSGELLGQFGNAYYTNIGSHLLISNTAEVLIESIDAYLQGRVLANDPVFMSGRRNFPEQTNLAIWLLTPRYFNSLYYYSNQQTRVDLLKYKTIVNQAEFMGLHSYQKDGVMHTQFELLLSKPEFLPKGKDFAVPSVDSL